MLQSSPISAITRQDLPGLALSYRTYVLSYGSTWWYIINEPVEKVTFLKTTSSAGSKIGK
jgi:hypothetical protein